jgi:hypothetical protein
MFRLHIFAYLDPATGSTLFQLAIATALSILATVRFQWSKLRTLFRRSR